MIRESWTGAEWQEHCCELLGLRYGEHIQFVPDRDRGDGGLEAYRLDKGVVYQCYAAQDAHDTRSLTDSQKRKINQDIKKLCDAPRRTEELIGSGRLVSRWILLTPDFDSKELVKYARRKSLEVRNPPKPCWCADDFEVVIHTDAVFAAERATLYSAQRRHLDLEIPRPGQVELELANGSGIADKVDIKLCVDPMLAASESDRKMYLDELIMDYVRGGVQRARLESDYPASFALIKRCADGTLGALTRILFGHSGSGPKVVETLTRGLADDMHKVAPALSPSLCLDLARYYVASWFIDCPLRFLSAA